jgi:hypothetical protein
VDKRSARADVENLDAMIVGGDMIDNEKPLLTLAAFPERNAMRMEWTEIFGGDARHAVGTVQPQGENATLYRFALEPCAAIIRRNECNADVIVNRDVLCAGEYLDAAAMIDMGVVKAGEDAATWNHYIKKSKHDHGDQRKDRPPDDTHHDTPALSPRRSLSKTSAGCNDPRRRRQHLRCCDLLIGLFWRS